jgi:hypothetical protein
MGEGDRASFGHNRYPPLTAQDLPGDEPRILGQQERHRARDILGPPGPAQRRLFTTIATISSGAAPPASRSAPAPRHSRGCRWSQLPREGGRRGIEPALRGGVDGRPDGRADRRSARRCSRSPPRPHDGPHPVHQRDGRGQVHLDHVAMGLVTPPSGPCSSPAALFTSASIRPSLGQHIVDQRDPSRRAGTGRTTRRARRSPAPALRPRPARLCAVMTTRQPSAPSRRAIDAPMPPAAPVTTATLMPLAPSLKAPPHMKKGQVVQPAPSSGFKYPRRRQRRPNGRRPAA